MGAPGQSGSRGHTLSLGVSGRRWVPSLNSPHHVLGYSGCIWSFLFRAVERDVALMSLVRASRSAGAIEVFPDLAEPKPNAEPSSHLAGVISCQGSSDICTGSQLLLCTLISQGKFWEGGRHLGLPGASKRDRSGHSTRPSQGGEVSLCLRLIRVAVLVPLPLGKETK